MTNNAIRNIARPAELPSLARMDYSARLIHCIVSPLLEEVSIDYIGVINKQPTALSQRLLN